MNFSWPQEYIDYKEKVVQFAQEELNEDIIERDHQGTFLRSLWQKCADFGIQGLAAPKDFGGQLDEVDIPRSVLAMEGLGYGCKDNGLALGLNAQMWTVQLPIAHFGTDDQKKRFLQPMVTGEKIGVHALTEPEAGSDVFSMQSTVKKVNGGYILNGKKHLITLSPLADIALVFATTNPKLGKWGLSAFLVNKETEGFNASPVWNKMGMRTVPFGALEFKDCFIPEENRLGKEGSGFGIMMHSLEFDRCCILSSQLGSMQRQFEETLAFAKNRKQFGREIMRFQSVANRIVDMKLRLETARLLLYKTAWLKKEGKPAMLESAMLKLHMSESFVTSSLDSIRTFGGRGYLTETGVERNLRDAVGGVIAAGTSDIQRNVIAKLLEIG